MPGAIETRIAGEGAFPRRCTCDAVGVHPARGQPNPLPMHEASTLAAAAVPAALTDAALIDAKAAAATGSVSLSWWLREVRAGNAPKPAFRSPRCTRWRLSDVRKFWLSYADQQANGTAAERSATKAKLANAAAASKRQAAAVAEAH